MRREAIDTMNASLSAFQQGFSEIRKELARLAVKANSTGYPPMPPPDTPRPSAPPATNAATHPPFPAPNPSANVAPAPPSSSQDYSPEAFGALHLGLTEGHKWFLNKLAKMMEIEVNLWCKIIMKGKWSGETTKSGKLSNVTTNENLERKKKFIFNAIARAFHPNITGCTEGFSNVENYEENAYKMTNSLTVFHALEIKEILKFSCNFLVSAFHELRKL